MLQCGADRRWRDHVDLRAAFLLTSPTDHGFDVFYGPPESYDQCLWEKDPWYDPERDGVSHLLEGFRGQGEPTPIKQLTYDVKRNAGCEYVDRAKASTAS